MRKAGLLLRWDRILAAVFDSEEHRRLGRDELSVRSTVMPSKRRGQGGIWPQTNYPPQTKRWYHLRK